MSSFPSLLFLVSVPTGILVFQFLKKSNLEGRTDIQKGNIGKNHHRITSVTVILLLSIVCGFLAGSSKTSLVIALIFCLAIVLEKSADHSLTKTRRNIVGRELPLLLDFLVLQVESGHSILQAFQSASALFPENSPVNSSLLKFQEKIQLGASIQFALEDMADFLDTKESETALLTISQAMKHGTPLGDVLRNQSNHMREQLVLEGEKFANTLSVKLLIPLLFFIFPASFLVIFSPVFVSLTRIHP